jgi:transposase
MKRDVDAHNPSTLTENPLNSQMRLPWWKLSRCVFVGDAGMVSQENLDRLSKSGGKYILCMPMRRGDEVTHEVLQRPGRFQKVSDNLRVKEVVVGEGERRRRYGVCHNPQEEKRQRAHRRQVLYELEAELASLKEVRGESHSKRVCQLRASRRYGRYLRLTKGGLLRIDAAKRRAAEQLDGKFVVHSHDDSLTPADLALGYKQLQRVEEAWRSLKSGLRVRPVYHWAVHRIHAHVALSVLALLLERIIEQACGDTWRHIRADLERIKLAQLLSPHGTVWQVTEPSPEASKHLKSLELENPPAILHLS